MRTRQFTNEVSTLKEHIEIETKYAGQQVDTTQTGELCPRCNGGQSNERSFSVTRERHRILFICHRSSCGFRGVVATKGGAAVSNGNGQSERESRRSNYEALRKGALPHYAANLLNSRYGIDEGLLAKGKLHWTEQHSPPNQGLGRVVMPVMDRFGFPYGYVARKLDNQVGAKAYSFVKESAGAWYNCKNSNELIIVEDQLSALRACRYLNSVALLGTNLTDACLKSIQEGKYEKVYLALDPDAFSVAIRMAHRIRDKVKVTVLKLNKDIKNMDEFEMIEWLDAVDILHEN